MGSVTNGWQMKSYLLVFYRRRPWFVAAPPRQRSCARCLGTAFPYGTFIINIIGLARHGPDRRLSRFKGEASQPWRLFLMTGILGGYTTFSAFSLDAALLYERGEIGLALFYVLGSVVFSIAGLFAGLALVRHLT